MKTLKLSIITLAISILFACSGGSGGGSSGNSGGSGNISPNITCNESSSCLPSNVSVVQPK